MKVSKIIGFHLPWKHTIVQFSPIRSGSTLLFNLLSELYPKASIEKQHTYGWYFNHLKVISSVRHPFDCVGSIVQAHKEEPTMKAVEWTTERFLNNGGYDITKVKDRENVRVLRYESFVNDYDVIFDTLEEFMGLHVDPVTRETIKAKFSRDGVRKIMAEKKNFFEWDDKTLIHGDHISARDGQSGYGKEMFTQEQQEYIAERCKEYMTAFDYQ